MEEKKEEVKINGQIAIIAELERIDNLLLTDKAETIASDDNIKIIKTNNKIAV